MKVVCISENWHSDLKTSVPLPFIGEECLVVETRKKYEVYFYVLDGRFPADIMYNVDNFAPISEIDETTFERNYNKEFV